MPNLLIDGLLERLDSARRAVAAGETVPDLGQLLRDAAKEIAEMAENLAEAYAPTWPAPGPAAAVDPAPATRRPVG